MFTARKMVEGLYAGRHRSPRRGHSTEFYDFRAYRPGDDPRRVDWKVFGRTDRLYVRRFRHDAELVVHLLVDTSASMDYAWPSRSTDKSLVACRLAAALGLLAVRQSDRFSLSFIAGDCTPVLPVGNGHEHLARLVDSLEQAAFTGTTDARSALNEAHLQRRSSAAGRGLVVLISDMLGRASQWLNGLGAFVADRYDVMALQVLTPNELDLRGVGGARLVDAESRHSVRTYGPQVRQAYTRSMARHIEALRAGLASHGADHLLVRTDRPAIEALRACVVARGARPN